MLASTYVPNAIDLFYWTKLHAVLSLAAETTSNSKQDRAWFKDQCSLLQMHFAAGAWTDILGLEEGLREKLADCSACYKNMSYRDFDHSSTLLLGLLSSKGIARAAVAELHELSKEFFKVWQRALRIQHYCSDHKAFDPIWLAEELKHCYNQSKQKLVTAIPVVDPPATMCCPWFFWRAKPKLKSNIPEDLPLLESDRR